ncbi:MAG: hypothetical protein ACP5NN_07655 [Methanolinea sp.]
MKRTALLPIGIASATILVLMALWILITGTFYLFPTITIDPMGDEPLDEFGMLVLTGTTNLPLNSHLFINVSPAYGADGAYRTEFASVAFGTGGRNSWRAVVNASALPPGRYEARVSDIALTEGGSPIIPGAVTAISEISLPGQPVFVIPEKEPYIRINTIGQVAAGETTEISGTTSLPPGTVAVWKVDPVPCSGNGTPGSPEITTGAAMAEGLTTVTEGISGVHRWSCSFNTAGIMPGCYRITVSENTIEESAGFSVNEEPYVTALPSSRFITIDSFPNPPENTIVVLTGTTDLPAGEDLYVVIIPDMGGEYDFLVNPQDRSQGMSFSGVVASITAQPGSGGINLWSMDFDTYRLDPGRYTVEVSNSKTNQTTFMLEQGDVSAATSFIIGGEPA